MPLTYRTDDAELWGTGKGAKLTSHEIDSNFWDLNIRLIQVEQNPATPNGITSIQVIGTQMTIFLADGTPQGPFTIPIAMIHYRGDWVTDFEYNELDIITVPDDGLYLVLLNHQSGETFDPNANNGVGSPLYRRLMPMSGSVVPEAPQDDLIYGRRNGAWVTVEGISTITWNNVTGKPSTFPPSSHFHTFLSLTDTPTGFGLAGQLLAINPTTNGFIWVDPGTATGEGIADAPADDEYYLRRNNAWVVRTAVSWNELLDIPAEFPPISHSHSWSEVTDKPTEFPPTQHGHAWGDVGDRPLLIDALPASVGPAGHVLTAMAGGAVEWQEPPAGEGGETPIVFLTQAQYDALDPPDPDTLYLTPVE